MRSSYSRFIASIGAEERQYLRGPYTVCKEKMACRGLVSRFDKAIVCLSATDGRSFTLGFTGAGLLGGETCERRHAMGADSIVVLLD